ncbi:MAG: APC family permease [Polyangiaceae bacterium]|nr:APC family permease [Polyangiaceae bacterium]
MGSDDRRTPELGAISLLALGVNGMVGVGIFFAPSEIAGQVPGAAGAWVYPLTALLVAPVGACYAVLGARFSRDGGPLVWAEAAFGKLIGFTVGWITYVSALLSTAAVLSGLGEYLALYLGFAASSAGHVAAACVLVLSAIAAVGLRFSAWVWNGLTIAKLVPLVALLGVGLATAWHFTSRAPLVSEADVMGSATASSWFRAVLIAVFALQGFEVLPLVSSSVRNRARSMPFAIGLSLAVVALLYLALHYSAVMAVPQLASAKAPLSAAATALGGPTLHQVVSLGTQISAIGISFGMIATTPRYLAALGGDDSFGTWLGRRSPRNVPLAALGICTVLTLALVLVGELGSLFVLAAMAVLAQFAVSVFALAALAWREEHGLTRRHLGLAVLALVTLVLVGLGSEAKELITLAGCIALGFALRWLHRLLARRAPS